MKTKYKVLIAIVVVLIAFRIYLPTLVTNYVNKTLADLDGYTGHIDDVDLHLYRGAYKIIGLEIFNTKEDIDVPFVSAEAIDLSVEWKALFQGEIVGEIVFETMAINFVSNSDEETSQAGEGVDWTEPIKELLPIQINRLAAHNSEIHFQNLTSQPPIDLPLHNIDLEVTNISNSTDTEEPLPSDIRFFANSIGGGNLSLTGGANLLKEIPDLDLNFKFENVNLPALNDFLREYAKIDAERGEFNLYAEFAVNDSQLDGYVKPLLRDVKILTLKDKEDTGLNAVWQGITGFVMEIFENQPKDQFATKVPMQGDLSEPNTSIVPALWTILRNAFIEALNKSVDDTIEFGETETGGTNSENQE